MRDRRVRGCRLQRSLLELGPAPRRWGYRGHSRGQQAGVEPGRDLLIYAACSSGDRSGHRQSLHDQVQRRVGIGRLRDLCRRHRDPAWLDRAPPAPVFGGGEPIGGTGRPGRAQGQRCRGVEEPREAGGFRVGGIQPAGHRGGIPVGVPPGRLIHPIEHRRYVARATGADPALVTREAASALAEMCRSQPAGLLPACRRLIERHIAAAPLGGFRRGCSPPTTRPARPA